MVWLVVVIMRAALHCGPIHFDIIEKDTPQDARQTFAHRNRERDTTQTHMNSAQSLVGGLREMYAENGWWCVHVNIIEWI